MLSPDFTGCLSAFYTDIGGYLYEGASIDEIKVSLTRLAAGERYLNPTIVGELMASQMPSFQTYIADLSRREREIFRYAGHGYNTPEIARLLFISTKTVETHKLHIVKKLNLGSVAELRSQAMELVQNLPKKNYKISNFY